ncbi:hypothetical protein A3A46_02915 [Candidatus Roizmanbacteria bacterium RIFCSPLOWO2_01_FULL_37_13]|uniref:Polymerase beta nucleotidyltransferase domain-containing protein n=1 Tax=Candidatus Roizmanbacteria bacterium RIFCSPHIGHO2_02_FULL_38_11 TaxID=1802039 RepID=A0A1F7H340_9BACT|nr:MAG: hypothetical protein A3C25_00005 [Candidatus Roizmanbacteria bacterium RIFCSPHIGHO2_02_FULL_38_11]OGK34272.1 MAG: hypothetical protein A3F58_02860 [Candidatus Roizmanbacteria bacterium RIFCSPHIGHO2_12_FULL_37_9b]OGK43076.1 MAG: hypothetical protein A3A46_02915 [Candidatus Roizmanbacteria bacterium RIFCSPLOWO2_01_FULL_37_13]
MKPQAIILFGSAAWGKPHKDSDLDVLMIKNTNKSFTDRVADVHLKLRTHFPVDVIVLTPKEAKKLPKENSFIKQIFEEGKLIYGGL